MIVCKHHLLATLLLCSAPAACSSNQPPPPDTFISAKIGAGPLSPSDLCDKGPLSERLGIGTATGQKPTTVPDNGVDRGTSVVRVRCAVTGSSGGYKISLFTERGGTTGGSFQASGQVDLNGGTVYGLVNFQGITLEQLDCKLTYTYGMPPSPVPITPPVNPGRIWGHLSCPKMVTTGGERVMHMDGTQTKLQCASETDFLFENCSQ
jgi:hypothetical protein